MLDTLFKEFEFNEKADNQITEVNGIQLPIDYLNFMMAHNGREGNVGSNGYAHMFKLEELKEVNDEYEVSEYIPSYVVFGTDGGGMLLGYSNKTRTYFAVDSCTIDENDKFYEADTLEEFFIKMDEEVDI